MNRHQTLILISGLALLSLPGTAFSRDVIWDLGGTLIRRSNLSQLKAVGFWNAARLYFQHGNSISKLMRTTMWNILNLYEHNAKPHATQALDPSGAPLPVLMQDWLIGNKTSADLATIAQELADKYTGFYSNTHKKMIKNTFDWMFTPASYAASWVPIKKALKILSKVKNKKDAQNKPANRIFMLSNFDKDTFDRIKQRPRNKKIFKHFHDNDLFVSAPLRDIKPRRSAFQKLLDSKNIDIRNALLIDDQEENCKAFVEMGGKAIHVPDGDFKNVRKQLEEWGVL